MNVCFVTDPLVTTAGAVRPALLLARQFNKAGHTVTLVTSRFSGKIVQILQAENICVKKAGPSFSIVRSFPTLDAWARSLLRHNVPTEIRDSDLVINTSSSIITLAHAYYAQGPMTRTLDDISPDMILRYRYAYRLLKSPLKVLERDLIERFRDLSRLFIANSAFCASMYNEWGISVDMIINPPLDCSFFEPATSKPTADYVLTCSGVYGKEGKMSIIKRVADGGVKIKVFGHIPYVPKSVLRHPNIDFLGEISDEQLVSLYSNALYTLFVFNHEPFGYIPIESMACGTPVLTYDKQGPAETVIDEKTGWLAKGKEEAIAMALDIWKKGYDINTRSICRRRALVFETNEIFKRWLKILNAD